VVDRVTPTHILTAVESLASEYDALEKSAQQAGQRDFSQQKMIISYREIYERILGSTSQS
jgi:glycogen synthase